MLGLLFKTFHLHLQACDRNEVCEKNFRCQKQISPCASELRLPDKETLMLLIRLVADDMVSRTSTFRVSNFLK